MPLHVAVSDDDDDLDMPEMPAPSPSPWERQSHLAKLAVNVTNDDTHSHHSVDSDNARPPSYHYVMKKNEPRARSTDALDSPARSAMSPGTLSTSNSGSKNTLEQPKSSKSYIETTC